jgi:hypothetical protein
MGGNRTTPPGLLGIFFWFRESAIRALHTGSRHATQASRWRRKVKGQVQAAVESGRLGDMKRPNCLPGTVTGG